MVLNPDALILPAASASPRRPASCCCCQAPHRAQPGRLRGADRDRAAWVLAVLLVFGAAFTVNGVARAVRYEFLLSAPLSEETRAAFPELSSGPGPTGGGTALWGPVRDATELAGLLARFSHYSLTIVEMRQLPD
jgi:hypothetical protein